MGREICGNHACLKAKASFYDYCIAMHDGEDSPLGDFVSDMKFDDNFPKTVEGRTHYDVSQNQMVPYRKNQYRACIIHHLRNMCACNEAKEAFSELWKEWQQAKKGVNQNGHGVVKKNCKTERW